MKMLVHLIAYALQVYLIIGVIIALSVQPKGLKKIDPSVEGAGVWFRVLTFAGIVALWPVILFKWVNKSKNDS